MLDDVDSHAKFKSEFILHRAFARRATVQLTSKLTAASSIDDSTSQASY